MDQPRTNPHQENPRNRRKNPFSPFVFIIKAFKKIVGKEKHSRHHRNENQEIIRQSRQLNRLTLFLVITNTILEGGALFLRSLS